jgi:hypothetical protein
MHDASSEGARVVDVAKALREAFAVQDRDVLAKANRAATDEPSRLVRELRQACRDANGPIVPTPVAEAISALARWQQREAAHATSARAGVDALLDGQA